MKLQQFQSQSLGIKWSLYQQTCLAPIASVLLFCTEKLLPQAECRQVLYRFPHEHCWLLYRWLHTKSVGSIYKQSLLCTTGVWNYFLGSVPYSVVFCFSLVLNAEAFCKYQYQLSCPYVFTTQSAPLQQAGNWKIHESGLSNLSSLPIIMFSRFCFISENFVPMFLFKNLDVWKKAAKWVYGNESFTTTEYVLWSLSWNLNCHKVQVTFEFIPFLEWPCISEKVEKEDL